MKAVLVSLILAGAICFSVWQYTNRPQWSTKTVAGAAVLRTDQRSGKSEIFYQGQWIDLDELSRRTKAAQIPQGFELEPTPTPAITPSPGGFDPTQPYTVLNPTQLTVTAGTLNGHTVTERITQYSDGSREREVLDEAGREIPNAGEIEVQYFESVDPATGQPIRRPVTRVIPL